MNLSSVKNDSNTPIIQSQASANRRESLSDLDSPLNNTNSAETPPIKVTNAATQTSTSPASTRTNWELVQNIASNGATFGRNFMLGILPFAGIAMANTTYQYSTFAMGAYQHMGEEDFSMASSALYATANSAIVAGSMATIGVMTADSLGKYVFVPMLGTAKYYLVPSEIQTMAEDTMELASNLAPVVIEKASIGAQSMAKSTIDLIGKAHIIVPKMRDAFNEAMESDQVSEAMESNQNNHPISTPKREIERPRTADRSHSTRGGDIATRRAANKVH